MKTTLAQMGNSSSQYFKAFGVAPGKVGKTCWFVASILGALPEQKYGLVDKPEHLHLLGFDEAFADGLASFLTKDCKKGPEYLNIDVRPLTEVCRKASLGDGWNMSVSSAVLKEFQEIKAEIVKGGTHAVLISSLTGMALAIEAGLAGAPDPSKKGAGMDMAKWGAFAHQLNHLRNIIQSDTHHTFWEGHITKTMAAKEEEREETVSISGKVGQNWGFNVEHVWRIQREMVKYPGTTVDKVYIDTKPTLAFVSGGRGGNMLNPKEYDLVAVAEKLGKKVGGYGKKEAAAQPATSG